MIGFKRTNTPKTYTPDYRVSDAAAARTAAWWVAEGSREARVAREMEARSVAAHNSLQKF